MRSAAADAEQRHRLGFIANAAALRGRRIVRQQVALGRYRFFDAPDVLHDAALGAQDHYPRLVGRRIVGGTRACRGDAECGRGKCANAMLEILAQIQANGFET